MSGLVFDDMASTYSKAGDFKRPPADLATSLKTKSLRPIAEAFVANIDRLHAFWKHAPILAQFVQVHTTIINHLIWEESGGKTIMPTDDPELRSRVETRMRDGVHDPKWINFAKASFDKSAQRYDLLLSGIDNADKALLASFSAQLLQVWTAFESLSNDLWVKAFNERPTRLVPQWSKGSQDKQDKSIPITDLHRAGFDVRNKMGTILRDRGRVSFNSIETTKKAYERAFGDFVGQFFDNPQLRVLELTRNLIAHRAGKIDSTFIKEIPSNHPFGLLEDENDLQLTDEIVRDLCSVSIESSIRIIQYVDNWMDKNP
jgi:hypothetical protein